MRNYSIRPRDDGRAARRVLAMPVARRNAWFADEVAIDFPSLHAAVERMREGFVAASIDDERRRRLSADLHLSPREAFDGVTVPARGARSGSCVWRAADAAKSGPIRANRATAPEKRSRVIPCGSSFRRACRTAIDFPCRFLRRRPP